MTQAKNRNPVATGTPVYFLAPCSCSGVHAANCNVRNARPRKSTEEKILAAFIINDGQLGSCWKLFRYPFDPNRHAEHWSKRIFATEEEAMDAARSLCNASRVIKYAENGQAASFHYCKYCGQLAEGATADLLCKDCCELFGHTRFSQL